MHKDKKDCAIPTSVEFRVWVMQSQALLDIRSTPLSLRLGFGKNTIREFLNSHDREMTLTPASRIQAALREDAERKKITLPFLSMGDL